MADMRKPIDMGVSLPEFAANGNVTAKIYRDEPILVTTARMDNLMPPKYRGMRNIARNLGPYASEAQIFYTQARFMEDFEDDFAFEGGFSRYFPNYQGMSNQQLRGYFSWRTKVRRGFIEPTALAFAFVYIYELLNQIGVDSALEGFYALKSFWMTYREIDAAIEGYVKQWLKDYVIYHDLDKALLDDCADTGFDDAVLTLLDYQAHNAGDVFAALNVLSSYDLGQSRFYKKYAADVEQVVYAVFAALADYYARDHQNGLCTDFLGTVCTNTHYMFNAAVFYRRAKVPDRVYIINDLYRYHCKNGVWKCERFFSYRGRNRQVGALLKTVDFLMRRQYNFKSALKAGETPEIFHDIIKQAIGEYQAGRKKAAIAEIEIDVSKLQGIRSAALETQDKLLVAEPAETVPEEIVVEEAVAANNTGLDEVESQFIRCLLAGGAYTGLLKSRGLMLSVVVDAVNAKLFDLFGDSVIMFDDDRPLPVADYTDELKKMIAL